MGDLKQRIHRFFHYRFFHYSAVIHHQDSIALLSRLILRALVIPDNQVLESLDEIACITELPIQARSMKRGRPSRMEETA